MSKEIQRESTGEEDKSMEICDSFVKEETHAITKQEELAQFNDNSGVSIIVEEIQTPTAKSREGSIELDNNSIAKEIIQEILNTMRKWVTPAEVEDRKRSCSNITTK